MTVLAPLAVLVAAGFVLVNSARVCTERRPAAGAAVGAMRGATASIDVENVPAHPSSLELTTQQKISFGSVICDVNFDAIGTGISVNE